MAKLNVPEISVNQLVKERVKFYSKAIKMCDDLRLLPAALLWGLPGVGKSEAVCRQIAPGIEALTGRHVEVRDVRLSNCTLTDIIGIPSPDDAKEYSIWLKPSFLRDTEHPDDILLLFFDEIDKASANVQAAALQLILDKKSFVHELPKNCIVLAAGNPDTMGETFRSKLRTELNNRFGHFHVTANFSSWKDWAKKNSIHPYVIDYLTYDSSKLYVLDGDKEDAAFPSPRSWAFVSGYLDLMLDGDADISELHSAICSYIGLGPALEFESWVKQYGDIIRPQDIFNGQNNRYPRSQDSLFSLVMAMTDYLKRYEVTERQLKNGFEYAKRFPADYYRLFYENVQGLPHVKQMLLKMKEYRIG